MIPKPTSALRLRQLLALVILILTLEGVARKAAPPGFGIALFLLKDLIVLAMAYYVFRIPSNPAISFLWNAYKILAVLLIPLIALTAWHDPVLAVFGTKQYLLFTVVAFAVFHAFEHEKLADIFLFYRRAAYLIIPTGLFAVLQSRLPFDHWLNLSVSGESLSGFSAAGQLRVSSTFPFVAQYCAFLNAQTFLVLIALCNWPQLRRYEQIVGIGLIPSLVYCSFITGSRGAVTGNLTIFLTAGILVLMRFKIRHFIQILGVVIGLYLMALAVNYFSPTTTAAYLARENGNLIGVSSEVQDRIFRSVFFISEDRNLTTFFGYGLGVNCNGAETFSSYAANWRAQTWIEADYSATLFEGGYYLLIVWYGFRAYIIITTTLRYLRSTSESFSVPLAVVQGYIIILGFTTTLASQPPMAIWWWMGVGTSILFWWKSQAQPDEELKTPDLLPPPEVRAKGRSMYSSTLHTRK